MGRDHYTDLIIRICRNCQQTTQDALRIRRQHQEMSQDAFLLDPDAFEEPDLTPDAHTLSHGQDEWAGLAMREEEDESWYFAEWVSSLSLEEEVQGLVTFAYPPATEQQLLETEQLLGFPLPPLLRLLYRQIANGGFGPGSGIIGAIGGFWLDSGERDIAHGYQQQVARAGRLVRLTEYEKAIQVKTLRESISLSDEEMQNSLRFCGLLNDQEKLNQKRYYLPALPEGTWPEGLLPLCDWGCAISTYIDANTEHIFQRMGGSPSLYVAASLEEWLERWLAGEALQFL